MLKAHGGYQWPFTELCLSDRWEHILQLALGLILHYDQSCSLPAVQRSASSWDKWQAAWSTRWWRRPRWSSRRTAGGITFSMWGISRGSQSQWGDTCHDDGGDRLVLLAAVLLVHDVELGVCAEMEVRCANILDRCRKTDWQTEKGPILPSRLYMVFQQVISPNMDML